LFVEKNYRFIQQPTQNLTSQLKITSAKQLFCSVSLPREIPQDYFTGVRFCLPREIPQDYFTGVRFCLPRLPCEISFI